MAEINNKEWVRLFFDWPYQPTNQPNSQPTNQSQTIANLLDFYIFSLIWIKFGIWYPNHFPNHCSNRWWCWHQRGSRQRRHLMFFPTTIAAFPGKKCTKFRTFTCRNVLEGIAVMDDIKIALYHIYNQRLPYSDFLIDLTFVKNARNWFA